MGAEYDALARHYDAFTAHPEYASWVRGLESLARRHGLNGLRALDLGCGDRSPVLPAALGADAAVIGAALTAAP